MVVAGAWYDGALYFLVARNTSEAHYSYRADLTKVTEYISDYEKGKTLDATLVKPYLVLDKFSLQTPHFLLSVTAHDFKAHPDEESHTYIAVEPEQSHQTQLRPGELIIFTQSTLVDADRYAETYDDIEMINSEMNRFGQEIMRVYRGLPGAEVEGAQDAEGAEFDLDA